MAKMYGLTFPEQLIEKIIADIKEKQELNSVEKSFVREILIRELQSNFKLVQFILKHDVKNLDRSGKYKDLVKKIRSRLRIVYGVFQTGKERDKLELLEILKQKLAKTKNLNVSKELHSELLKKHLSTKERQPHYPKFYKAIWKVTGKPRSIIDLGCGLNPLSFPFMDLKKVDYYASELNFADVKFLNAYFDIMEDFGLYGKAVQQDLSKIAISPELFKVFPKSDIAFALKLFDSLKVFKKSKKVDGIIIEKIPATWVVASFPTKTIGQKSMSNVRRDWLEKLCSRKGWSFKKVMIGSEILYIIKK